VFFLGKSQDNYWIPTKKLIEFWLILFYLNSHYVPQFLSTYWRSRKCRL